MTRSSFHTISLRGLLPIALVACAPLVAAAQIAVLGSTVEERSATPGESYIGALVVKNLTNDPQPVRIYQTDYSFFADGTSHFDAPGSAPRSNASWVSPSAKTITVPPASEMSVTYTVRVPKVDTLRGTYWSNVMVEGAVNAPRAAASRQVEVGSVMRYSVQIASHVGAGESKISFSGDTVMVALNGSRTFGVKVGNPGERAYRPLLWLEVYDQNGALKSRTEQQRGLLYPGSSLLQKFDMGHMPPGSYKIIVFADTGSDAIFAHQHKLVF